MYVATITGASPFAPKDIVMPVVPVWLTVTAIFPWSSGVPLLIFFTPLLTSVFKASKASSTVALFVPAICLL